VKKVPAGRHAYSNQSDSASVCKSQSVKDYGCDSERNETISIQNQAQDESDTISIDDVSNGSVEES